MATISMIRRIRVPRGAVIGAYAFLLPALLVVGLFTLAPIVYALYMSVQKMDLVSGRHTFVGLRNLAYLVDDDKFWAACYNTILYVAVVVPLQTVLAMVLACAINSKIRFKRSFVTLLFLPTLTSSAAMTMIFMWLFNNNGVVVLFLQQHLGIGINFLGDPKWALGIIMMMNVFSTIPHFMVVFLAGLQEIPGSLYEAALLDGAGPVSRHWEISVPQLMPITCYVLTMGLIGCFQVFDQAFILSGGEGGPENATLTFTLLIYHYAFKNYNTMGLACALAVVLTLIIFCATLVLNRFVRLEGANR
ncbi:sugar ABC transporter permease [Undibacterium sp. TS12]|uniref:carbohydrate ABC transporter permease n=1 Tax=Undibacterium sp. TS12 TaxID=2908202 RepID=UPI001F4D32BE|nr:sugar ABC transporter permease [Undibacterium sp. TS12]MCH8621453.1 sugar ABC transporter permease [Undibacterium sp. TS12]